MTGAGSTRADGSGGPDARNAERPEVISIKGVSVIRSGHELLDSVDWQVRGGDRWVLLGPNGSGKTTLISVAATYLWPSRGTVSVLGSAVGSVDVRELRRRIGIVSASLEVKIPPQLNALEIVEAGATGATAPWWDRPSSDTRELAQARLELVGCAELRDRRFQLLSSGERQRVQIARALMLEPRLLLLDEPAAGLDLGAREQLAVLLARLNADPGLEATVVVTHHVEEIAPGTTHAIVLRSGRVLAAGPVADTVTGPVLTAAFGLPLRVERVGGRFVAQAAER
jgi:iron complex transport system ATP-binding protein